MVKIEREDIKVISRHSNWSEKSIKIVLRREVYNTQEDWQKFLKLLFISLGIAFTTAGILFFFAFNWADIHKFVKLALIESLIVTTTVIVLFTKLNVDFKNILLTGSSILVGVLFAVFGQIYQTGADAYDFFLAWTVFITLWVAVSNFAPLWLLYLLLINTTFILYTQQVAYEWSETFVLTILFLINTLSLTSALVAKEKIKDIELPVWFTNTLALAAITFSTSGISFGIFALQESAFALLLVITLLFYTLGVWYGLRVKSGFYLSSIPFSIIIITTSFLIKLSDDAGMFFIIILFVILSVTLVIKNLINLQRKWKK